MNPLQLRASNPEVSTWVSASAGTGKTKILTDRVLRLLLNNAKLDKILCLTFTNAAAGEMKERIALSLAKWSKMKSSELRSELSLMLSRDVSREELLRAKYLYELYLRSNESINIQTIHAFCQALLKRFPLEAGVSPNFKIIDETKAYSIMQKIKKGLANNPEMELINDYLTANFHELTKDEIFSEIIQQRTKFTSIAENIYEESSKIINSLNQTNHKVYKPLLNHPIIQNIVGFDISVVELKNFFLTQEGQKKKRIVAQKIAKTGSNLYDDLEQLQNEVFLLDQSERADHIENYSKLISLIASEIINEYENYKNKKALLDYDDLIIYAGRLLKSSSAKEWVLYKLDGGIDHLLVDEAQDTSISQWQIVEALIEEFYAGESRAEEKNRTVFVVGDEKQSIFSFQGADISSFAYMNKLLKQKMTAVDKKFEDITLEISYRSAPEIINVVHKVFSKISNQMPSSFTSNLTNITAFRNKHTGSVELWPLCISDQEDDSFWKITKDANRSQSPKIDLAQKISTYIKNELSTGRILPSTGKVISPSDFMILFRKRDEFTNDVIQVLKNDNIEVSGLDRISLKGSLAVLDLLSVAKFALNNDDDLNLASLLKSKLIDITEDELYDIAISRDNLSIWEYLKNSKNTGSNGDIYNKLNMFIDLFNESDITNFFQYIVDILGYRERLNSNSGSDSNDVIDEFLYICNDFALQENNSIQNFILWLENYESSIKRDNNVSDKIQIMTVHASKGLQAPFVILCDTNNIPTSSDYFLWDKNGKTLSAKNSNYAPGYYKDLKEEQKGKAYAEYLRLLYVGMTRAEDHLIICGYQGGRKLPENCWYELIRVAMVEIKVTTEDNILIYGQKDLSCDLIDNTNEININYEILKPKAIDKIIRRKELQESKTISSPLLMRDPIGYGLVFHKILEDSVNSRNLNTMKEHPLIDTLSLKLKTRIEKSIDYIISNKDFIELLQKDFKTEVPIGSILDGEVQIGRIDLMVIGEKEVIIIDYKSDISVPSNDYDIPCSYKDQLSNYRVMTSTIYPKHNIRTMILWLQNGSMQEIF